MARTRASVGAKVSAGKSSKARCSAAPPVSASSSSGSSDRGSRSYSSGNPVCPRETPKWQKPITSFFVGKEPSRGDDNGEATHPDEEDRPGTSSRARKNIILSDDEDETSPIAHDESLQLEALTGEECHKIEEYYLTNERKGKGVGKRTKGKENEDYNVKSKRNSIKRGLEASDEELESATKKIKVV